jgi:Zn-dependent M28 family amino/carboxypeptidase
MNSFTTMNQTLLILALLLARAITAPAATDYAAEGEEWWARVKILAADNMEGRNTGSDGYRRAAAYVAGEFDRLGLKPSGTENYYQPIRFRVRQIIEEQSSLELVRDGQPTPLSLSDDANFALPPDLARRIDAPAVFVGHGLVIPELNINDLAGLDLKGKIAVVLAGGPKEIPGAIKAHYSHPKQQWGALRKAGAIGLAVIRNPKSTDIPWSRSTLARLQPVMSLADPKFDDTAEMKISLRINPAHADKFLAGTGHTIADLLQLADDSKPLPKFPLAVSIRATVAAKRTEVMSMNVAGVLEGSDPQLKNEYVVLSAHLDHLGIGQPINGDSLYNGAMDNASGVATILEVARRLKESGPPKRSVLFLAVTGEEKGLLGSKYFANRPTVPKSAIVADLNIDMFLPIHPLKIVRVFGLGESTLGDQIRAACSAMNVEVQPDPEPDRNIFIRSDQYSFIRQGIPALFFGFGYEPGSPEEQLHKDWLKNRYHAPSDDLYQPVDKAAAAQFNHLFLALTQRVADAPERPQWNPESFFRRFAPAN